MTNGELVSRVVNDGRFLNKDEHISKRYILSIAKGFAKTFMSQKIGERGLYRDSSLLRTIQCFELVNDDVVNCNVIEFRKCESLMKSKNKLPNSVSGKYGSNIIVTSIDGSQIYNGTNFTKYNRDKKRVGFSKLKSKYFFEIDGYLYLPDSTIKAVNIIMIPENEYDIDSVSSCSNNEECKSGMDYDFICPDSIINTVITSTINEVMSTYRRVVIDENPNLDENQKGKTVV